MIMKIKPKPILLNLFYFLLVILPCFKGINPQMAYGASYSTLDPSTRKSLEQFDQLFLTGNREQIIEHLQRVINSVGYIKPLAGIYYRLAQNETEINALAQYYTTLIDHWPSSAWAQKAVCEFVPILLMADGMIDSSYEEMIWRNEQNLLSKAEDAAELGEDPALLQGDVLINLIYLSHSRKHASRVIGLAKQEFASASSRQDEIDLARTYALLHLEQKQEAVERLQKWLDTYPNSGLRPLALYALFHASRTETDKMQAVRLIRNEYPDTLEAVDLREYVKKQSQ